MTPGTDDTPTVPAPAAGKRPLTLPIRWHLVLFVALVLVPQVALGLCLGWWYSQAEHKRLEQGAVAAAAAVSDQLDRELESMKAALLALATSPNAVAADFPALRAQAETLLTPRKAMLAVRDRDHRHLLNTLAPDGQPLPQNLDPVLVASDDRVFATGRPGVSDLFRSPLSDGLFTAVIVPLATNGETRYAMSMALRPNAILDILVRTRLPKDWVITVLDTNDRVVARSREQTRFLGQRPPAALLQEFSGRRAGVIQSATGHDGTRQFIAFNTLDLCDWRVAVGVPAAALNAPFRILVGTLAAITLLALGSSVVLARLYSMRLVREITSLRAMASATGSGAMIERRPGRVSELEDIAEALRASDASLVERNRTRDLLLSELNHRVRNTLSVLLSVVNHTIRSGGDDAMAEKTSGRIMALSRAHDLLSHAEWSPVSLSDLVRRTSEEEGLRIAFEGPDIRLRAEAVAPVAQVLHELTVNQRRHGGAGGRQVVFRTAVEPDGVRLAWIAQGAPGDRLGLPGFGLRLVRLCLERQLFGRIERLDAAGLEAVVPHAFLSGEGLSSEPFFAARWRGAGPQA
ncbi:sensor histidine kinase [Aureimonas phyllosphaerae]|uniref:histidine kinase n=1 Tax=Aureimonas phyllosphaerae TaxID=1166078 RepID=A0A7W6BTW0_9HYPH|nr:HWE histidine kinase domain-containing protein [Aureimonas phyllosphaerae]MBB3936215.1 two-component sensor histidine kinase [Aureimonas phyllosphaerae]MBB3960060.1 two-component sensor histidine kinase [Aureimonas phyllosphaerae]SFF32830.1 Two-component sensor histidine kinase, contains HisKA and HATPase domains [Aureimonas phyllosphaerae]